MSNKVSSKIQNSTLISECYRLVNAQVLRVKGNQSALRDLDFYADRLQFDMNASIRSEKFECNITQTCRTLFQAAETALNNFYTQQNRCHGCGLSLKNEDLATICYSCFEIRLKNK